MPREIDLWGREARQNTHALYAQIREEEPISRAISPHTGNTVWVFTRYDDVLALLKDQRFIKDYHKFTPLRHPEESINVGSTTLDRHLLTLDPPDHTRLRMLVQNTFTPRMIAQQEARIRQAADMFISEMKAKGSADLIDDFALSLPVTVIANLLGIPTEDHKQFRQWTHALIYSYDGEQAAMAGMQMLRLFLSIIEQRRNDPQDDLISALIQAEADGDQLDTGEMLSMIFLLLTAGHETTVNLIGNGVLTLLQHPDQLDLLRRQPELIGSAVEELLRYNGPVENTFTRFAADDIEWHGVRIARGDVALAAMLSANRDPRQFADPERFDITRSPNKHISFGHGIHFCLGAPLARLEGGIAINMLIERLPDLALAVPADQLEWNAHVQLRGLRALPITF